MNQTSLLDPIAVFAPATDSAEQRQLRRNLLTAREMASAGLGDWYAHAEHIQRVHAVVAQITCEIVFASAPAATLELAVDGCRHLLMGARLLDRLEQRLRA